MRIKKTFDFDAAHQLLNLPDEHKCRQLHGHTYRCTVVMEGPLDPVLGWVIDYGIVQAVWDQVIHAALDHKFLNAIPGLDRCPTTEMVAPWILRRLLVTVLPVVAVEVFESSTTSCECTLDDLAAMSNADAHLVARIRKERSAARLPVVED